MSKGPTNKSTPITNNSTPITNKSTPITTTYTAADLRNMEADLLQKLDKFNNEYTNYMKYLYNMRHNTAGDTSIQFKNPNNSPITVTDFPDLKLNQQIGFSAIYIDLFSTLQNFIYALNVFNNQPHPTAAKTGNELQTFDETIIKTRRELDHKLYELNEVENSLSRESRQHMKADVLFNILWTALATSLVYYIIVHR